MKKQISELASMRNGFGVKAMGDKEYRHPEYAAGYFKAGGLIPGSTHPNRKKILEFRSGAALLDPKMSAMVKTTVAD